MVYYKSDEFYFVLPSHNLGTRQPKASSHNVPLGLTKSAPQSALTPSQTSNRQIGGCIFFNVNSEKNLFVSLPSTSQDEVRLPPTAL